MAKKKKRKAKKREKFTNLTVTINLSAEHRAYVEEVASYACVAPDLVCAVMMGCGIFQAKRYRAPNDLQEHLKQQASQIMELEGKLCQCRQVMEANDPGNALNIFGPPSIPPKGDEPPPAEGAPTVP